MTDRYAPILPRPAPNDAVVDGVPPNIMEYAEEIGRAVDPLPGTNALGTGIVNWSGKTVYFSRECDTDSASEYLPPPNTPRVLAFDTTPAKPVFGVFLDHLNWTDKKSS